ncbi:HAD hydrolase family protein [Paenibacillus sp. LMG 31456]|uniref:HAD hydrolase family protein n=1 Tax=Paenibacillus foliorum TaxID=2654974 RepID=A0A972K2S7_9BACL|nr:HAD hydrolase family protein [Paenibacillus foliorum]NOU97056.1 HAD hydrolase family protein [Paenibacillus foliorum]
MKTLYALSDLDGTLLLPNATVSEFTQGVITQLLNEGHVVSYATARSYASSQAAAGSIPWKHPLVLYNGALLYDPVAKKRLGGAFLNSELTNELLDLGRSFGHCPLLFALDEQDNERVLHEPLVLTGYQQFAASRPGDKRFCELPQLFCPDSTQTLILTYIGHHDELVPLLEAVSSLYTGRVHIHFMPDAYIADHYFLEISHPNANKKDGLFLWAQSVGCQPEEVIAFGDNLNDLGLLEAAGTKVAVGNAQQKLKEAADLVIDTNREDGVAKYLLQVRV